MEISIYGSRYTHKMWSVSPPHAGTDHDVNDHASFVVAFYEFSLSINQILVIHVKFIKNYQEAMAVKSALIAKFSYKVRITL